MKSQVTSQSLEGITELTLLAPIKQGFVDALDTITYETRLRRVMQTLGLLRSQSREFAPFKPFSDAVERIQSIQTFRLALLEREKKVALAVTFDRPWEPYIRLIYRDLGYLLDVILCNCDGYVPAFGNSYESYVEWIRSSQIQCDFFYTATGLTITDLQYLRQVEKAHREARDPRACDVASTQLYASYPEELASAARSRDATNAHARTGLEALYALYRLTDLYPADRLDKDGGFLLRAAQDLLREFDSKNLIKGPERAFFKSQLEWFEQPAAPPPTPESFQLTYKPEDVQGGILTAYEPTTHGCLILLRIVNADAARAFLGPLPVSTEGSAPPAPDGIYVNVAFTFTGLQKLGLPENELEAFPKEFREGMQARAGGLGDVRSNHPRNWRLPERNWPDRQTGGKVVARVQLSAVDVVVQLRFSGSIKPGDHEISGNAAHPLYTKVKSFDELTGGATGMRVLSVQTMLRYKDSTEIVRDHLDFADGFSQPVVAAAPTGTNWDDRVRRGEILWGYPNDRGDSPPKHGYGDYLSNGTFLVVRKLRLDVHALKGFLGAQARQIPSTRLLEKMIGRTADGEALAAPGYPGDNDFNYDNDRQGVHCPFQAHIRRANPRTRIKNKPVPRILRRGMSYGPRIEQDANAERGLIFLAYNASIAEQFEVIQRWLSGGNSSGVFSGHADPLMGVPQAGDTRTFRFIEGDEVVRVDVGSGKDAPFAQLEWGTYLFVPSIPALRKFATLTTVLPSSHIDGDAIIAEILALTNPAAQIAAWKAVLEDSSAKDRGDTAAVWEAIRKKGGVLSTPYGILIGDKTLVMEIFQNVAGNYTVNGPADSYMSRMKDTIGPIYLGLDEGVQYRAESSATNAAIGAIPRDKSFTAASHITTGVLQALAAGQRRATVDIKQLSTLVLARLSNAWFDVPDGIFVERGGWDWAQQRTARCPGDFTSPSRYLFSPQPGDAVRKYAITHGNALEAAVLRWVREMNQSGAVPYGVLSQPMFAAIPNDVQLARTLVGVMMGFLPTVDGSLRSSIYEMQKDGTLWRVQEAVVSSTAANPFARAQAELLEPLSRAMQRRPVPELVWRTATRTHTLQNVQVAAGRKVVLGIVSATHEDAAKDSFDVYPIFGGDRSAPNAPTHACPAFEAAMGVLLGIVSSLLEAGTLNPTPAPLIFDVQLKA